MKLPDSPSRRALLGLAIAASSAPLLSGCAGVLVAGAAGGALMATDRRSAGAQLDDTAIEAKFFQDAQVAFGDRAHVSITSFNGIVLLTGEVPDAQARARAVQMAKAIDRVRSVHDELVIAMPSEFGSRSTDAYITSMVKTRFLEATDKFSPTHVKVVTDRRVVYLMGMVTRAEGDAAARIAASTQDVERVVKVFEYID